MASVPVTQIVLDGMITIALLTVLGVVVLVDALTVKPPPPPPAATQADTAAEPQPPEEPPVVAMPEQLLPPPDPTPRILVRFDRWMRFGITTTSGNPDDPTDDLKRLIFNPDGSTNNARLWVDGRTPNMGSSEGRLTESPSDADAGDGTSSGCWSYQDVHVTQTIRIIPGQTSRRMDTAQVDYLVENRGAGGHDVGFRIMLDSLIGDNDGVPFIVPGRQDLVTEPVVFRGDQVPDFVRALEVPDLRQPGVIVDLGLRPDEGERPDEVWLTRWPGSSARWDYDRTGPFGRDTAVGLLYAPRNLEAGGRRQFRFTYGLGSISSTVTKNARLSLTAGGPFRADGKFWLVALVQSPQAGQQVRVELPAGLRLAAGHDAGKPVATGREYSQLSWLIEIDPAALGGHLMRAALLPEGIEESQSIVVEPSDAALVLRVPQPVRSGRSFWVTALVRNPQPGQSVELVLPAGVTLADREQSAKPVATGQKYAQVNWQVKCAPGTKGPLRLSVKLLPAGPSRDLSVDVEAGNLID